MTDKGFNIFYECAARCVHLSPQEEEEECASSSWGDNKMYASGNIANSQRMLLTKINESGAITKMRIWVESDSVKHLKTFRIIFNEINTSLLILS